MGVAWRSFISASMGMPSKPPYLGFDTVTIA
jgi:hypothetical protein